MKKVQDVRNIRGLLTIKQTNDFCQTGSGYCLLCCRDVQIKNKWGFQSEQQRRRRLVIRTLTRNNSTRSTGNRPGSCIYVPMHRFAQENEQKDKPFHFTNLTVPKTEKTPIVKAAIVCDTKGRFLNLN